MEEKLHKIEEEFLRLLKSVSTKEDLDGAEIAFLGRKGRLALVLRNLKDVPESHRPKLGQIANAVKSEMVKAMSEKRNEIEGQRGASFFDVSVPGTKQEEGHLHIVTQAIREISGIFSRMGFYLAPHREIDWDWYVFESLNMPKEHPARDEWETFFVKGGDEMPSGKSARFGRMVLTPHTSSGQVREMEKRKPPIRMMSIGKCFRRQIDISHVPMFHQFEGLLIDKGINITHLKGVLDYFAIQFFGEGRRTRIRPHHFQFTEPSFEVDISCAVCKEKGCRLCKDGWLELGGSGMVHPNVLRAGGVDPKKYSGFAFGWGVERSYMMKSGLSLPDIRVLYQNDLRFLEQF